MLKLGDKEVEYNPEFRFYVTTKLSNPHYTPEISSVTTIVNFAVKEQVCALVKEGVFCVFVSRYILPETVHLCAGSGSAAAGNCGA